MGDQFLMAVLRHPDTALTNLQQIQQHIKAEHRTVSTILSDKCSALQPPLVRSPDLLSCQVLSGLDRRSRSYIWNTWYCHVQFSL